MARARGKFLARPDVAAAGSFKENTAYTPQDIRFTTKGGNLYAIALGWPADGKVVVTSLAKTDDVNVNQIERVELLGGRGELNSPRRRRF